MEDEGTGQTMRKQNTNLRVTAVLRESLEANKQGDIKVTKQKSLKTLLLPCFLKLLGSERRLFQLFSF